MSGLRLFDFLSFERDRRRLLDRELRLLRLSLRFRLFARLSRDLERLRWRDLDLRRRSRERLRFERRSTERLRERERFERERDLERRERLRDRLRDRRLERFLDRSRRSRRGSRDLDLRRLVAGITGAFVSLVNMLLIPIIGSIAALIML